MKVLTGIALGLIGFLLFLTLPVLVLVISLNNTLLNPDFIKKEINRLEITEIGSEILSKELPQEYQGYTIAINNALVESEPWIRQNIDNVIDSFYSYVRGKTDVLNITIPLGPGRDILIKHLTSAYLQSPPPGYPTISEFEIRQNLESVLPVDSEIEVDAQFIGTEIMSALEQAKNIVGYIHISYIVLSVLVALFIFIIILILRNTKGICITLGTIFIATGALGCIGFFTFKYIAKNAPNIYDIPAGLQTWISGFINDSFLLLGILNLIILTAGIALLAGLFLCQRFWHRSSADSSSNEISTAKNL